jgi:O-antigen ligase
MAVAVAPVPTHALAGASGQVRRWRDWVVAAHMRPLPRGLTWALAIYCTIMYVRVHELFTLFVYLRLVKVSGIPLLFMLAIYFPRHHLREIARQPQVRALGVVLLAAAISIPMSAWPGWSFSQFTTVLPTTLLMLMSVALAATDRRALRTVLSVVAVGLGGTAVRLLLPGAQFIVDSDGAKRLAVGVSYDSNDTAALLVSGVPIALFLFTRTRNTVARLFWLGLALLQMAALLMTGSRGGLVASLVLMGLLIVFAPKHRRPSMFLAVVFAAVMSGVVVSATPALRDRYATIFDSSQRRADYNYTSEDGRIELWKRGIRYMFMRPLNGYGYMAYMFAESGVGTELKRQKFGRARAHTMVAHNAYVQVGAELGIPGLVAYLTLIWLCLRTMLQLRRDAERLGDRRDPAAAEDASLAGLTFAGLSATLVACFFLSLAFSPIIFFYFGLCTGLTVHAARVRRVAMTALQDRSGEVGGSPEQAEVSTGVLGAPDAPRFQRRLRRGGLARVAS